MKRNQIFALMGVLALLSVSAWIFWPNGTDQYVNAESAERAGEEIGAPEGAVQINADQIVASAIEIEAVQFGAASELIFPATVAAAPNASARIDARASGVVRSVNKTLGDYVRLGVWYLC